MKESRTLAILLLGYLGLCQAVAAEISGSGSRNSGCQGQLTGMLWQDLNANHIVDSGEPGLGNVVIQFVYGDGNATLTAITNTAGHFEFNYLCEGDYLAVIDESTVPEGMFVTGADGEEPDLGGWPVQIADDGHATLDLGYIGCQLAINSSCSVASLATELYRCEKPIDELSLVWNGSQNVRVVAHHGNRGDPVLADIDGIAPGEVVTVKDFAGSGSDVIWEIFAAGTDIKLGESRFRMDCDDAAMDGPEDCGLPQGDGKDDDVQYINNWLLDGIVDDSGLMECTNRRASGQRCEFQSEWVDCERLDKVNWLTFSYTGGGCEVSKHDQPDKFECTGHIDDRSPVMVLTESGDSFVVEPGASFTIPNAGGDTGLELSNDNGTESLRIHTSCSRPLAAGDVFGSLTLAALNGLGIGAQIDYEYELDNKSDLPALAMTREAPLRTLHQPHFSVGSHSKRTVAGSAYVTATSASALLAEHYEGSCSGADFVHVVALPREPCEISGSGIQFDGGHILWDLAAGAEVSATIERIEIEWPSAVTDRLKEIKLDGDKIFDQDRFGGAAVIDKSDLEGELHKRRISHADSKQLKISFHDDVEGLAPDDVDIEVFFKQGCTIRNR